MLDRLDYWYEWLWVYDKNWIEYALLYDDEVELIKE